MAVLGLVATEAFPQLTITQSQTWVPPQDGTVCIHVVGAGGGGTGRNVTPQGGGAGAYAKIPTLAVTTSGSYALVVGVGGAGVIGNNDGGNGGSSTIAGTGLTGTKTCGGGTGGNSGGNANGSGGSVSGSGESWAGYSGGAADMAGGAVGIYATGAAGVTAAIGYGGMTDAQSGGLAMSGYGIICGGSRPSKSAEVNTVPHGIIFDGDDLCGGGSWSYWNVGGISIRGGTGGIGGGGGGARNQGNATYAVGGDGGDGIILIQYLPW